MPAKTASETWPLAPGFNTGLAAIDAERQQLLQLIYQAHRLAEQGASTSSLLQQARDLIVCTAAYFRREEMIMQALKHPTLEATLVAQGKIIQNLQQDFNSRAFNRESIGEFIIFLKDCLIAHIINANKNLAALDSALNHKIVDLLSSAEPLNSSHCVDIYIVDDEQQHVDLMVEITSIAGLAATGFTSGKLFIEQPIANTDIILLDLNMPDMDGIEVMRTLYNKGCTPIYILVSGFDERVLHSVKQFADTKNIIVAKKLSKPINTKEFIHYISQLHIETRLQLSKSHTPQKQTINIKEKLSLEQLKTAIRDRQLVLFYQPKLDLKSRKTSGFEALVRLQHPELGLIFPDQFIAMAEENNLISELTYEVFRLATEDYVTFREAGIKPNISINISAQDLLDLSMPERFAALAKAQHIPLEVITIELTETAILQSVSDSLDILNRLRMKGFSLSIDDFGTGYSSLVQLYQAPFTELKIDQHFVMKMLEDDEALSIVKICILLAKELNMTSVAEGIESQEIWDKLAQLGCDLAQGYLISKPVPVDVCCRWVAENQPAQSFG
ncbi:MAG: EAL domain-containing protein [Gammaproteobacteria bacterium]|nr:EAL domain-containing protein [Gammaproteobacteria bacterium]MBQ0841087.1 EAL domain-containing protein [Gammaproteobacteria bacterium]